MAEPRLYAAIDFKSFYASVECVERGLDPLSTNLVVADASRTEKTICLAVSPSLKKYGLPGRCRLFEVQEKVREIKAATGEEIQYIVAPPRMKLYMSYSTRVYEKVYLKYAAPEDIHVYSIDEVFIDITRYLPLYHKLPFDLVRDILRDILRESGITATAGIGTNLYLAKVALDVVAKHVQPGDWGERIAILDERQYRRLLWEHTPITDFWRVGRGISRRLEKHGCLTMGDVARKSLTDEESLYREFGIDAELLIDHAWGWESCTMADIKAFRPESNSMSVGQVLPGPYSFEKGRLIVHEMADQLALDLFAKDLVTDSVTLSVGFDRMQNDFHGETESDWYGRRVPKPAHATLRLTDAGGAPLRTSSNKKIVEAALRIYDAVVAPAMYVRRFYVVLNHVEPRRQAQMAEARQMDLFTDPGLLERERADREKEERIQRAMLEIKGKFGKNAILKGISYEEGATARERNSQVGGHAAGEEE
ncbi:MAG: DNA methylase [Clostridia bacterium]|nr:DNA methylase [Clostridia bacterium]